MKCGAPGLDLVKRFEACRLKAFKPTPHDVWTIGWGHTKGVKQGDTCTQEKADAWLVEDITVAEGAVNRNVKVTLTQNQFDALCSFAYNIGEGAFKMSTLLKKLNSYDRIGAANELKRWNKQAGNVLQGLVLRRQAEKDLFLA